MKYFLLTYFTVEDYIERREAYREEHLQWAHAFQNSGALVMGGALHPPNRAVLVFRCPDESEVERFVHGDPYVENGLVSSWELREWKVVVGNE